MRRSPKQTVGPRNTALLFGALAVAVRLPFLISGKIPFDSDEAVEGLMARHVLNGDLPAFFWGQAFKGVPEVYAAAAVFALFGSSVVALKSVTLAFFAAYVGLNFVLLDRMASRWMAVATSLLLIFAPPALVFWSLDASAEYIVIMLLGTMLLLLCLRLEEPGRAKAGEQRAESRVQRGLLLPIGLVCGVGFWTHQIFVFYLIPAAFILIMRSDRWRRRAFGRPNAATLALGAIAIVYVALGLIAFLTGGFAFRLGPLAVSATAPQKMLRIAAGITGLAAMLHVSASMTRERARAVMSEYWPLAAGFLVGYLPVLLYSVLIEPARSPARVADLRQLMAAAPDILGNVVPILAGFKIATTERLAVPLLAVLPGVAALGAYVWSIRGRLGRLITLRAGETSIGGDFFALFVLFVPTLFLASGAYLDTQSYRYLIPWYAGLAVAWAAGSLALAGQRKPIATAIVGAILAIHAWQQVIWYQKLTPDVQSISTIACLERNGIRGGFADYWTAYKITFLAHEAIVIAPANGIDRNARYTAFVRSLPDEMRIDDAARCH